MGGCAGRRCSRRRAWQTGGRLPLQPVVDALRPRLERENAPEDLLSDVWQTELGRLLPELRDRYPDLPVLAGDEAAARTRLFEAIARLGEALARRAPAVLLIDDVQWADHHALAAGLEASAIRFSTEAGDIALQPLVARDALEHYGQALESLPVRIGLHKVPNSTPVVPGPTRAWHRGARLGLSSRWLWKT